MKKFLLMFMLVFTGCALLFAQDAPEFSNEMKKMQEQMKAEKTKNMEMLRKDNPQVYEQMTKQEQISEQISQISANYFNKKITYENAKARLYPLVKENMSTRVDNLDPEIKMLEQRLEELKRAKANPDDLIYKEIDGILGKSSQMSMPASP